MPPRSRLHPYLTEHELHEQYVGHKVPSSASPRGILISHCGIPLERSSLLRRLTNSDCMARHGLTLYSDPLTHNTERQMATQGAEESAGAPEKETPAAT